MEKTYFTEYKFEQLILKLIMIFCFTVPNLGEAQVITAVANGNFTNPATWDCTCIPSDGDSIEINKIVTLDTDLHLTTFGIRVKSSGKLLQDTTPREIWLDGTSQLYNSGTVTANWIHVGQLASVDNNSNLNCVDSLWLEGYLHSNLTLTAMNVTADETGFLVNNASMTVANNFSNLGLFDNSGNLLVENDFFNCNGSTGSATTDFSGLICIMGDMTNCIGDSIYGPGVMTINGASYNYGSISGPGVYKTGSGTFDVLGDFDGGVLTTGSCGGVGLDDKVMQQIICYPSPATTTLILVASEAIEYEIVSLTGALVSKGKTINQETVIDISNLEDGSYLVRTNSGTIKFVK